MSEDAMARHICELVLLDMVWSCIQYSSTWISMAWLDMLINQISKIWFGIQLSWIWTYIVLGTMHSYLSRLVMYIDQ